MWNMKEFERELRGSYGGVIYDWWQDIAQFDKWWFVEEGGKAARRWDYFENAAAREEWLRKTAVTAVISSRSYDNYVLLKCQLLQALREVPKSQWPHSEEELAAWIVKNRTYQTWNWDPYFDRLRYKRYQYKFPLEYLAHVPYVWVHLADKYEFTGGASEGRKSRRS